MVLKFQGAKTSDEFVDKYRDLFSSKSLKMAGKMGDRPSVLKKLERFKLQYPQFTEDIIFQATQDYIKANLHQPMYIMDADNFIFKIERYKTEEKSRLAAFCEEVGNKIVDKPANTFWE